MVKFVYSQEYSPEALNRVLTVPNVISFLRICSIPYLAVLIAQHKMWPALIVLAIAALSDCIDGYIARTFNQVSKLGQILDPIADRLLIVCSTLALVFAKIIPWWALALVVLRDAIMAILIVILAQYDYGPLPVNFMGKTGTALLMVTIVLFMIVFAIATEPMLILYAAAIACAIWGITLYWFAGILYCIQAYKLLIKKAK
ncbi:CDP-diacylglycerol--glycerol-3-phosphate 3-phosphatidyltransferase [Bifidobacteriaceae bacterium NR026]|uniref:CDP-alcohol phosphatidyltransferase family protein n=1 Tax=Gardnerella pickettii TaxID=2914924 RepID=A0ABX4SJX7_9BIFI|nr:CDP-alcohol phosphatidyltransferase family protein [Gardnerella pickettii]MDK7785127.1 CDP-alcohol phosphatidyltransferase family protein [Bifidobacterium sp. UMB6791B]MDK8248459.1 CDP-alcohol phosphatidyltransferase family protein [Bifidobacterium sp. UMB6794B]MDK8635254.1 CDP-alcohol phosphatidyltransferase family protein [Bifidobacterium sp. UMB6791A]RIY18955.1 CDP-diacylglycerol--glycerol-3-phosphate 3-phosphatidyltransferase [Bifidobacteriaceae bacterium NR026]EIK84982.1 CDP-diacylglyc